MGPGNLLILTKAVKQPKLEMVHSTSISQVPTVCQASSGCWGFSRKQNRHRLCPREFLSGGKTGKLNDGIYNKDRERP